MMKEAPLPESGFAQWVDTLAADAGRGGELTDLLREDHPCYDQRGGTAVVRMRGWVLLALARRGPTDGALVYIVEELDTGNDPYLIAAAARALRACAAPNPELPPFVMHALVNIRGRNEPVSLDRYGEYATSSAATNPVRELLVTLAWLGPCARNVLTELRTLRAQGGMARPLLGEMDRTIAGIAASGRETGPPQGCCALLDSLNGKFFWAFASRGSCRSVQDIVFEDHTGASARFAEIFQEQPSIVVFFYTRCDNPLKCSLTISKLARIQHLLEQRGLGEKIRTAAVTYDPAFDTADRLRGYGHNRGLRLSTRHRMLRAADGMDALRRHFSLGVNFVSSLVNRHQIELYILDRHGRIAASFCRIRWDEEQVVARALEVAGENGRVVPADTSGLWIRGGQGRRSGSMASFFGTLASVAVAFFPKCPMCWAAYMSVLGLTGLEHIPYLPWLKAFFVLVILVNVAAVWWRGRQVGSMGAFYLVTAGSLTVLVARILCDWPSVAVAGIALIAAGSLLSALDVRSARRLAGNP